MIADSTFAMDLLAEQRRGVEGRVTKLFHKHRAQSFNLTIITVGEVAAGFESQAATHAWLQRWRKILPLHFGIMYKAAEIDRFLTRTGQRLGENDNWIAGFAYFYQQPLLSRDEGFDRAKKFIRRVPYEL